MRLQVTLFFIFSIHLAYSTNFETIDILNTAANASYLSTLEKEVIYEINLLRTNPAKYAINYIAPLANNYKSKMLYYPGDKPLKTREGVRALNECVRELKRAKRLPLVYPNLGLTKAAEDHVNDQSKSGRTGHRGGDRSDVRERIERYGDWNIRIAENIAYGGLSARQIIIYLLIDDGIRDRGHRKTFLHPDYKTVGVAVGTHPGYKSMWVMDFAGSFTDN
ncbi:MAG: CAP domain-containing protein [Prolixibacteraceae bacterium]|jgi:uncharacterized protein YkwD|nr:CAP domain-containing protein [Prolixibacteraceae bacterium]MBT6005698.1 CAP domain-containing protein [Prolixibacteraceae bacterium]MBT6765924.1 CAP domain-containing protein [Prolixibacteraceae bacterium]MBT6998587.1 CAP domain-containing protein [Prolixibacteraceae bacterium]MBT7395952.1 CAP domain-containing protein [Prolixibacteraceae bacterium]